MVRRGAESFFKATVLGFIDTCLMSQSRLLMYDFCLETLKIPTNTCDSSLVVGRANSKTFSLERVSWHSYSETHRHFPTCLATDILWGVSYCSVDDLQGSEHALLRRSNEHCWWQCDKPVQDNKVKKCRVR